MFTPLCRLFHLLQQRPGWLFSAACLATLLSLFPLKEFGVRATVSDLFPSDWESARTWREFGRKFGSMGHLAVLAHSPDPRRNLAAVETLARHLETHPGVNFLEFRTESEFYRRHKLLYISLDDLREVERRVQTGFWVRRTKRNPLILDLLSEPEKERAFDATSFEDLEAKYFARLKDLLGSADSTTLVLRVYPAFDATDIHASRAFLRDVQAAAAALPPGGPEILYSGEVLRNIHNEGRLFTRVLSTTRLALALSGLFLLLTFLRFPAGALLATVPVAMAACWTLALTQIWLGPLGLVSAPLALLLAGLGLCFAIHLLARYAEERRKRLSAPVAFETILLETGPAIAAGSVTLALAFLTFLTGDFAPLGQFGLVAGLGMVCNLVAVLAVFPSLLRLLEPLGILNPFGPRLYNFTAADARPFRAAPWLLLAAAILTALALRHGPQWRFQTDLAALGFPEPDRRADSLLAASGSELAQPAVFLLPDHAQALAVAEALRLKSATAGPDSPIGEVATLLDLLPADQEEKLAITARLRRSITPEILAGAGEPLRSNLVKLTESWPQRPLDASDLPENYRKKFLGSDGATGVFTYAFPRRHPVEGTDDLAFARAARTVSLPGGRAYSAGGLPILYGDLAERMVPSARKALGFGLSAVFLVLLATVRSLRGAMALFLPVLCTLLWMLGSMKWLGIRVNPYNLVAFPAALAYATIHSLHLYHRYEEEGLGSLGFVIRRAGPVALITALVGAAAFIPMAFADHRGLASLGVSALAGMAAALLSTLLLLPGVLGLWEQRRAKQPPRP